MRRITTATRDIDLHGTGKDGWRDGDGSPTLAPTRGNADWFNQVQEEIAKAVEYAGVTLNGDNTSQLHQAMRVFALRDAIANIKVAVATHATRVYNDVIFSFGSGSNGEGMFIAFGKDGDDGIHTGGYGAHDTWPTPNNNGADWFNGACEAGSLIVVVGQDSASGASRIWSAPVGTLPLTLTVRTPAGSTTAPLRRVCHNGTVYVAVGDYTDASNNSQIQTSTTGTAGWTKRTPGSSSTADYVCCAARTDTGRVLIGSSSDIQASDDHGVTWTQVNTDGATDLVWLGGNDWLAIDTATNSTARVSDDDGATWTDVTLTGNVDLGGGVPGVQAYGLVRVGNAVVSMMRPQGGTQRPQLCVSVDKGLTWLATPTARLGVATITDPGDFDTWNAIATDGARIVAAHEDGTIIVTHAISITP